MYYKQIFIRKVWYSEGNEHRPWYPDQVLFENVCIPCNHTVVDAIVNGFFFKFRTSVFFV